MPGRPMVRSWGQLWLHVAEGATVKRETTGAQGHGLPSHPCHWVAPHKPTFLVGSQDWGREHPNLLDAKFCFGEIKESVIS